jgi:threonine/homoserine efflux transporter RhtA
MRYRLTFFKGFLLLYSIVLIFHALELPWSIAIAFEVLGGIALALFAHLRKSHLTLIFLVIHMVIEWIEYGSQVGHYSIREIVFYGIHTSLDFIFLWQEAKMHLFKYRNVLTVGVFVGLLIMFFYVRSSSITMQGHPSSGIEAVVLGGIFGCLCSHLLQKRSLT